MKITLDYRRPTQSHCTVGVFINGDLAGELVLRQDEVVAFQQIVYGCVVAERGGEVTDSTSYCNCIDCGRSATVQAAWFYLNGWGPICGFCWYKFTQQTDAPKTVSTTIGTK